MSTFEAACAIELRAQATGAELISVDPRIIAGAKQPFQQVTRGLGAGLAWPALRRKLDRKEPGYPS